MGVVSGVYDDDYDAFSERNRITTYAHEYPIDPAQLELESRKPWGDRFVVYVDPNGGHVGYGVDGLRVSAPSDIFRARCVDHWTTFKAVEQTNAALAGLITLISCVGAIAATTNPMIMTTFAVACFASTTFMGMSLYHASQASDQIAAWSIHPAEWVAKRRTEAYQKGFSFAFLQDLKIDQQPSPHGVLSPQEISHLFNKYFPQFCANLLNRSPNDQWMADFFRVNPLSQEALNYAYNGNISPVLQALSFDFENLRTTVKEVHKHFSKLADDVRSNTCKTINAYDDQRAVALGPYQATLAYYTQAAKRDLAEKLKNCADPYIRDILRAEYKQLVATYQEFYNWQVSPINAYFDNQIAEVRRAEEAALAHISSHKSHHLSLYAPMAQELLRQAFQVWTTGKAYSPLNFGQYYNTFVPQPSAPPPPPTFQPVAPRSDWTPGQVELFLRFTMVPAG